MPANTRLLIIDDNVGTRYAIKRTLEHHGYQVDEAGSGEEGLASIAKRTPDALILDVNLPDMSGFDIVRQLRTETRTALTPVIHVSAAAMATGDMVTGLEAGADAYLIHPVDPDVLLATLRSLLRVRDTEAALRESEERFHDIFANIAAPIAVIDSSLAVLESNHAFLRLLEQDAPQLATRLVADQDESIDELKRCVKERRRWSGTLRLFIGSTVLETEWRVTPYRAPDVGILFVDDVTEQRERERDQLEQLDSANSQLAQESEGRARAEAQLLQAQKMDALGKLTGGIAHDFNNLLTGIITGVEMMTRRIDEGRLDGIPRLATTVLSSAQRAAALTHRLLAFARQQPLDARSADINKHVSSLEDLLRRTIGESIRLIMDLSPNAPIARVDVNQLENAVLNLVINARDALPQGGEIKVNTAIRSIHRDSALADGDYVAVSVSDNGTGIAPDVIDKVFDPFFTTKPPGQGTGLGLSMIYGFARQSGGHVRIRSRMGIGTEVTILLPTGELPRSQPAKSLDKAAGGGHEHILLVEDMATVRVLAAELLINAGYRCTQVADVETAQHLLKGDPSIDLLLTDVGLPGMSGRELAEVAREDRPHLPVLLMTGYAGNALDKESFLGKSMDLITKPFEIDTFLRKVRNMLDSRGPISP
ncbi:response regulator [Dyella sp.]|uniref:response regulator n=1 Tax=Dyella sp. TaxID=1869338 RepID=UPI002ED13979